MAAWVWDRIIDPLTDMLYQLTKGGILPPNSEDEYSTLVDEEVKSVNRRDGDKLLTSD